MPKRPIQEGDVLSIRAPVVAVWPDEERITVEVNGQRITMRADNAQIEMVTKGETFERPKKLFDKPD